MKDGGAAFIWLLLIAGIGYVIHKWGEETMFLIAIGLVILLIIAGVSIEAIDPHRLGG